MMGAVAVAINAWLTPEAIVHCIDQSDATILIVDEERATILEKQSKALKSTKLKTIIVSQGKHRKGMEDLDKLLKHYQTDQVPKVDIKPEDDATIFFTSGTTSTLR